jgi:type III secretion system FlhB-like substrate exporter
MPRRPAGARKSGVPGKPKAVALRYWTGLPAPFLCAKADGRAADRLVAIAREAGVPIVEDGPLAQAVFPLELGAYVPEECFEIVARVFAFVKSIEDV